MARREAASRTWATEPGAEPSSDENSVCTESITQTSGRRASSVAHTLSSSVLSRSIEAKASAAAPRSVLSVAGREVRHRRSFEDLLHGAGDVRPEPLQPTA